MYIAINLLGDDWQDKHKNSIINNIVDYKLINETNEDSKQIPKPIVA